MMRRNLSCRFGLAGGLVLAAAWAAFTVPEQADAARPPRETIRFDVRVTGDMELVGTLDPQTCEILGDPVAEGRSDRRSVIVNRPSPAIQMDFLAALPECFTGGDIYGLDCGGTLVIRQARNGSASIEYFFQAEGRNGQEQGYRIDGDAMIMPDNGGSFPEGDSGYAVYVDNIRVSQDTGRRRNACEGSFSDAVVVIQLDRR